MRRFTTVQIDGQNVLLQNSTLNTLLSGEDQANDCLVVEEQNGYDTFDKATGAVDLPLGTTGASGDLLVRVIVTTGVVGTTLNIYDGTVATGTKVLVVPVNAAAGDSFECGCMSKNGGFTCEDDASLGAITAIGRFS